MSTNIEDLYDFISDASRQVYEFLNCYHKVSEKNLPKHFSLVREAYQNLRWAEDLLLSSSKLSLKQFTYDELYWMPLDFVDKVNGATLMDRLVLLGEAESVWNMMHSHLGRRAPICPLDLPGGDCVTQIEGIDY